MLDLSLLSLLELPMLSLLLLQLVMLAVVGYASCVAAFAFSIQTSRI
jgi:hypothetical protein